MSGLLHDSVLANSAEVGLCDVASAEAVARVLCFVEGGAARCFLNEPGDGICGEWLGGNGTVSVDRSEEQTGPEGGGVDPRLNRVYGTERPAARDSDFPSLAFLVGFAFAKRAVTADGEGVAPL